MVAASNLSDDNGNQPISEAVISLDHDENWDERTLCFYAEALRPSPNTFFRAEMNQYLLGPLNIALISRIIHHNNIHHYGTTPEQCGRLVVIMEARRMYDEDHDPSYMLGQVLNTLQTLQIFEALHPSTPCNRMVMRNEEDERRFENRYRLQ
uniref:NR LBD domain-containing protein n=1 Tax=Caenorhabditis tropicalis TaxID=1561998 RepID=A0A1I7UF34_9PELO